MLAGGTHSKNKPENQGVKTLKDCKPVFEKNYSNSGATQTQQGKIVQEGGEMKMPELRRASQGHI